jgi:hypothetical protein
MAVVAFIEPPQAEVIEKILSHCGLSRSSAPRAPPPTAHQEGMDEWRGLKLIEVFSWFNPFT